MGKYRLKSRQAGSVITLMEIDTESRAWYIKADHKEAALKALKDMGPALGCVETIYINGEDVSGAVFAPIAPMMDPDMPPVDFPMPEEPMESYSLAPDIPVFPTADDIAAAQEAEMAALLLRRRHRCRGSPCRAVCHLFPVSCRRVLS